MKHRYVRYVRNYDVARMQRRGWAVVRRKPDGMPVLHLDCHGQWSTIMEWRGYWHAIKSLSGKREIKE